MIVIGILLLVSIIYIDTVSGSKFSLEIIKKNNPHLLSSSYLPGYTAGFTFFIAVAATNLFHQGNWQRVFAAKNFYTLKRSLIFSFFIIIPIVFFMGLTGMVSFSINSTIRPDLGFFSLLLEKQSLLISLIIITLGLSLTISTLDTLINAISSLIVVDGKATFNFYKKLNYLIFRYVIISLSIIAFIVASKDLIFVFIFISRSILLCICINCFL